MDRRGGLTLIELLMVMVIIGMTLFSVPSMLHWLNRQGVAHAVAQLRADLQLARVMAIRQKQTCTLSFNNPGRNQYANSLNRNVTDLSAYRGGVHFMARGPDDDPMSARINFTRRGMTTPAGDIYLADARQERIYKIRVLVPGGISVFRWADDGWH